mmetsp:Transcript_14449/g.45418  ORF Transcript_14449/g.45418 Transcript_14449/m.45418 type:complete len:192 (+) Transcript_14449:2-577(+)
MKQLVACPRARSARRGWGLLQRLCMQAPPNPEATEFVRRVIDAFLERRGEGDRESTATARLCLNILDGVVEEGGSRDAAGAQDVPAWTPGVDRLEAENSRLRAEARERAAEIRWQAAEIERLTAEILRLGGKPGLPASRPRVLTENMIDKQGAAPMASAPRGGPSPVRFMVLPDSDSDIEIDLSEFADAGS